MHEVLLLHNESLKLRTYFNNIEKLSSLQQRYRTIQEYISGLLERVQCCRQWVEKRNWGKEILGHLIQAPVYTAKLHSP